MCSKFDNRIPAIDINHYINMLSNVTNWFTLDELKRKLGTDSIQHLASTPGVQTNEGEARKMNVVNDPAERVVKDIQDFVKTINDQEHRDHVIRVGQKQRKSFGKCRKIDLDEL